MEPTNVHQMTAQVSQLLADRLGARGPTLRDQLDAARRLPRRVRRAAGVLAEAEQMAASPKMARRLDMAAVGRAHAACVKYLRPIGAGERARSLVLGVAANVVLGIVVVGALALLVARWRGLI
ncbi:hypothetical protein [Paenirhodobacter sp.]|uniref:hypothetical protein n=1 Tax=Paenirhodobacter sp. TaxID=1965326 RepID=UPI003B3E80FD